VASSTSSASSFEKEKSRLTQYASAFCGLPSVPTVVGNAHAWRVSGVVCAVSVAKCIEATVRAVRELERPWAAISVWGFHGIPQSWLGREHDISDAGENDYVLLVLPEVVLLYHMVDGLDQSGVPR
jgi:hypothetical protein